MATGPVVTEAQVAQKNSRLVASVAIVHLVLGGLMIAAGLLILLAASLSSKVDTQDGVMAFAQGLISLAIGMGLWRVRRWARTFALIRASFTPIILMAEIFSDSASTEIVLIDLLLIATCAWIFWVLMRRDIRVAFD